MGCTWCSGSSKLEDFAVTKIICIVFSLVIPLRMKCCIQGCSPAELPMTPVLKVLCLACLSLIDAICWRAYVSRALRPTNSKGCH